MHYDSRLHWRHVRCPQFGGDKERLKRAQTEIWELTGMSRRGRQGSRFDQSNLEVRSKRPRSSRLAVVSAAKRSTG